MTHPVLVGTRRSPLAMRQTREVAEALARALDRPVAVVEVTTQGDVDRAPLATIGGSGVFVSALRDRLLAGEIDLAVHSLKDLPTAPVPGLVLAAVPEREDPRDALVGSALADLTPGARIGTGSPRRAAALRALNRGLVPVDVRGNIDTRLAMVADGEVDAVVLAAAGLRRLGRTDVVVDPLDASVMVPAPGQGALAVEARADVADDLAAALADLDDQSSRTAVLAERAALAGLEAGCSAPVGALAGLVDDQVVLHARVWSIDGSHAVSGHVRGAADAPVALGHALARDLLARGASDLIPTTSPYLEETTL
jgi:hydroxymethylbilane synthase